MSRCLITTQPQDLGFLQLPNDIIGNWFWRLLQAVFYETWNCWTKQKTSWTGARRGSGRARGGITDGLSIPISLESYSSFPIYPGRETQTHAHTETDPCGMRRPLKIPITKSYVKCRLTGRKLNYKQQDFIGFFCSKNAISAKRPKKHITACVVKNINQGSSLERLVKNMEKCFLK